MVSVTPLESSRFLLLLSLSFLSASVSFLIHAFCFPLSLWVINPDNLWCFQVVRHLIAAGHDVHVVTGAPDFVFTSEIQSPRLKIRKVSYFFFFWRWLTCLVLIHGIAYSLGSFGLWGCTSWCIDRWSSCLVRKGFTHMITFMILVHFGVFLALLTFRYWFGLVCGNSCGSSSWNIGNWSGVASFYQSWFCGNFDFVHTTISALLSETHSSRRLLLCTPSFSYQEINFSWKQVSDVVPVACRAAADAGIRSVCVTNFRWHFYTSTIHFCASCLAWFLLLVLVLVHGL